MTTRSAGSSYHHGDLRNALLEASARLIGAQGVEAFSLREAAREVGVSPNAAYRHFADKDALLGAVAADGFGKMAATMERLAAKVTAAPGTAEHAIAVFAAVGQGYVEFAVAHPAYFRVMFGPWMGEAGCQATVGPSGCDPHTLLVKALDALVATKVITPEAREGAEIFGWAAVHGLASLYVGGSCFPEGPPDLDAALQRVSAGVLAGLGARYPARKRPR
jgi:AcrR family transcriptional regulator